MGKATSGVVRGEGGGWVEEWWRSGNGSCEQWELWAVGAVGSWSCGQWQLWAVGVVLLQAMVCCRRWSAAGDSLLQAMVCYRRWSVTSDGLLQAMVCYKRWAATGDGLLQAMVCTLNMELLVRRSTS